MLVTQLSQSVEWSLFWLAGECAQVFFSLNGFTMASSMKKTNYRQFELLVDLMKENVDLAKGFCKVGASKSDVKEKWNEIGKELDALGPPMRRGSEWQKVSVYFILPI
jgi:hypothetical protein